MKIKLYSASIASIVWRFYLLSAIVIIGLFTHQIWVFIMAYAILITCMTGMSFESDKKVKKRSTAEKMTIPMDKPHVKRVA